MEIKVLGTGCSGCKALHETVKAVVVELKLNATVVKEEDLMAIMSYNILSLPALVVDGKVVSSGKKLSKSEVADMLKNHSASELSCLCGANYFCKCE